MLLCVLQLQEHRAFQINSPFRCSTALDRGLVDGLNDRPMKKLGGVSRRVLFERYDRPALKPLPAEPHEISEWKQVRVNLDYHVEYDKHWYSAPYELAREPLWLRATATSNRAVLPG